MQKDKLGTMPMGKLLINMSGPIILSMLIQALYNIVDSMFVARYSEVALNAVSLCYPIQMIMVAISLGGAVSVQALLARALGSKDREKANKVASHGLVMALFHSVIFIIFGIFFSKAFLNLFSHDQELILEGEKYMRICTIFGFGIFVQIVYERFMQATGNAFYNMIIQGAGALLNIILDPIFVFGLFGFPELGISGAAIATVLGQILGTLLGIIITKHKVKEIHATIRHFHLDKKLTEEMYRIAIPSMLMNSIMSIMTIFMNMILATYSTLAVSVFSIYFKLQQFLYMAINGMSNAVIAIISYNYGAKNKSRIQSCIKLSIFSTVVIMILGTILFQLCPKQLLSLFNASQEMYSIGIPALQIISLSFVFGGVNVQSCAILQSLESSKESLIITLLRQLIIVLPLAYLFSMLFGLNYIWISFPISEFLAFCISLYFLRQVDEDFIETLD